MALLRKILNRLSIFIFVPTVYFKYKSDVAFSVKIDRLTKIGKWCKIHKGVYIRGAEIGDATYIGRNCVFDKAKIGKFCCIASNVKVIVNDHPLNFISIHPAFYSLLGQSGISFTKEQKFNEYKMVDNKTSIIIGNDVWIGNDVKIIGGVTIGNGVVIATGAVVTKDIPAYSICGGVPAKVIKYRFDDNEAAFLESMQWWNRPEEWLNANSDLFTNPDSFFESFMTDDMGSGKNNKGQ